MNVGSRNSALTSPERESGESQYSAHCLDGPKPHSPAVIATTPIGQTEHRQSSFANYESHRHVFDVREEKMEMSSFHNCEHEPLHQGNAFPGEERGPGTTPPAREPISDGLEQHSGDLPLTQTSSFTTQPNPKDRKPSNTDQSIDDFDVYNNAAMAEQRAEVAAHHKEAGFCWQLGVTINRILILMIRRPSAFVCELLIPIIFVVGSIVLWVIISTKSYPNQQYYSASGVQTMNYIIQQQHDAMCYNNTLTGGEPIADFPDCEDLFAVINVTSKVMCATDHLSGAPLGLCTLQNFAARTYTALRELVPNNTTRAPSLDEMIVMQWATRLLYQAYGVDSVGDKTVESSIFSSGALYFSPASSATAALVSYLNSTSTYFPYVYDGTFDTVGDAESHVKQRTNKEKPIWGIVQTNSMTADDFDVEIRLNATALPKTNKQFSSYYVGGLIQDGGSCMYVLSGFTTLQRAVYTHYLNDVVAMSVLPEDDLLMLPAPTRAYNNQVFLAYGGQFVPLILVLGFLYPVSQMTKRVVMEKELRLREAMLIMGLSEAVMYMAWFLIYLVQYIVVSFIIAVLLKVTYVKKSNFGIIFFLFFFFCLSVITLSGLIAVFFSKARLAAILAPLVYFVLAIPLFAMQDSKSGARTGVSFLSPSGLAVGVNLIFAHELLGGMTGSDLKYFRDAPNMLITLVILFMDFLIYVILMLYLDAVLPKEWGTRRHPLFFITEPFRYCCCRSRQRHHVNTDDGRAEDGVFEPMSEGDPSYAIKIIGLRKKYRRGSKTFLAVNNLHWGMREGEISVLLGHNGAGKTTTMNMMTGMVNADAGDCYIYGYSVRDELNKARQEIGYCPQHNILWPSMTCYEHLWYYASIKGVRGEARDAAIQRMLEGVDLEDKRDYRSKNLSGGQKRKLSVAIAFVGGSRLVFLDEPTAGMDVGARRHTWGLLRTMSKQHSILLSTHFMDEADLLGDSIAIMSKGRLQCAGSNMFLKSKLGVGYVLTLSVVAHVDRQQVTRAVRRYVSSATQLGSGAGEMGFRLPMDTKAMFPTLLAHIEDHGMELGINAFSVSATTLEEIFIQIAQQEEAAEKKPVTAGTFAALPSPPHSASVPAGPHNQREEMKTPSSSPNTDLAMAGEEDAMAHAALQASAHDKAFADHSSPTLPESEVHAEALTGDKKAAEDDHEAVKPSDVWGVALMHGDSTIAFSQFKTMLWKRFWNAKRDRRTQFFQIVCPVLCVLLAMLLMLVKLFQSPAIVLTSNLYGTDVDIDLVNCSNSQISPDIPFSSRATTVYADGEADDTLSLSRYLLSTYNTHETERYTSMVCGDSSNYTPPAASIIFNSSALHAGAIGVYDLYNGYFMNYQGAALTLLKTTVATMPQTKSEAAVTDSVYALIISIIIMIPFTFIPSTFVSWVVKEREVKARHLQNVSGLFFSVYWASNFLFDMCCYIITMFLVIIVFCIFSREEYIGRTKVGPTIVLFFLYGLSGVAMAYAVSFLFKEHSSAQNVVMLANFIAGFLLVLCVSMLSVMDSTKQVAKILRWFFRVVPSYCVGEGIGNLATLKLQEAYGTDLTGWSMSVIGWPCLYMAIEIPFYVGVTLIVDHPGRRQRAQRLFHDPDATPEPIEDEDADVVAESTDVLTNPERESDLVRVEHLRKVYDNGKVAVRNLTFGVHPGEVFGFLGTNGAGKTTAISILCQEFYPTSGHAAVCGHDIVQKSREALRCIGYCPQFDATIDLLSVREHLELYAGVRAISYAERDRVVKGLLSLCELKEYKNTLAHELSGGNRRKLSVAISLIGGPRVVFLDEPSAGMDPVARRGLWTAIETVADNCSVVLTTHHLEEVEALAHRVAIMVDGALQCIGNKTHLKQKYGTGFEVNVRVRSDDEAVKDGVKEFFEKNFPGSSLREYRARRFTYELPATTKLSMTFKLMEEHAEEVGVHDYNVSQTSIEQVFLQISEEAERRHEAEEAEQVDKEDKSCCSCSCSCCC